MNEAPAGFSDLDVAVIGMSGRFPGAETVEQLWGALLEGRELTAPELSERAGEPARIHLINTPLDPLAFDASFFGVPPVEALLMDPQHRLFLECCYHALEHSGYPPGRLEALVGVYASEYTNTYLLDRVLPYLQASNRLDTLQAQIGNEKDHLGTFVAYKLGLSGPALSVQTACSSSLVAVHLACDGLTTFQCDMALAGGVTVSLWNMGEYEKTAGDLTAIDGRCRAFDESATGTVYSNGVGVVVLKRLNEALRDRDRVYAVIKGSAVNNDAADRIGYAAPSVTGQVEVIRRALATAAVSPAEIRFVECHGTGTRLGDEIELEALHEVFHGSAGPEPCALGTIKANIGHLGVASGVAGLIKASLALWHRVLPPQINVDVPRERLRQPSSPFVIAAQARSLPSSGHVHAAVSSFGLGGTNVHVVLQSPPPQARARPFVSGTAPLIFPFSAKTPLALRTLLSHMGEALSELPEEELGQAADTLQSRRDVFEVRYAVAARSARELRELLAAAPRAAASAEAVGKRPAVVFLFPARDDGAPGAAELLRAEWRAFSEQAELLRQRLPRPQGDSTRCRHRDLFVFQASLAQTLLLHQLVPSHMLGYGVGEVTALFIAGLVSLEDGVVLAEALDRADGGAEASPAAAAEILVRAGERLAPSPASRVLQPTAFPVHLSGKLAAWVRGEAEEPASEAAGSSGLLDGRELLEMAADPNSLLLEIGADGDFSALHSRYRRQLVGVRFLPVAREEAPLSLAQAFAAAWATGVPVSWPDTGLGEHGPRPLPGYPFERHRYEISPSGETVRESTWTGVADGDVEAILRDLWFDYFGAERPAGEDNFFEYGADSLSLAAFARALSRLFKIEVDLPDLYAAPTFEEHVQRVRAALGLGEPEEQPP